MKQIIKVGEKQITIRGMKFGELKELATTSKQMIESLFALLDGEDIFASIETFAMKNMGAFTEGIIRFTDLDATDVDELELVELTQLLRELLKANGLTPEKVMDFFTKVFGAIKQEDNQLPNVTFTEPIPMNL